MSKPEYLKYVNNTAIAMQVVSDIQKRNQMRSPEEYPYVVRIEQPTKHKTNPQLGYLHAVVLPQYTACLADIGEIDDYDEEAAKYILKFHTGFGRVIELNSTLQFLPFSYADHKRDTRVFVSKAIDFAIDYAAQCGVIIPQPTGGKYHG